MKLRAILFLLGMLGAVSAVGCVSPIADQQGDEQDVTGGKSCGGKLNKQCKSFLEYCDYGPTCGADDKLGVCKPAGDVCSKQSDPVCGCDGQTYQNACYASRSHVSVVHKGKCATKICGGFAGFTCAKNEFCDFGKDGVCGTADQSGTCKVRPQACTEQYAPVCGCDGKTHSNACMANGAGTDVSHVGPCEAPQPQKCGDKVCGSGQWCQFCWGHMACIPKGALC